MLAAESVRSLEFFTYLGVKHRLIEQHIEVALSVAVGEPADRTTGQALSVHQLEEGRVLAGLHSHVVLSSRCVPIWPV